MLKNLQREEPGKLGLDRSKCTPGMAKWNMNQLMVKTPNARLVDNNKNKNDHPVVLLGSTVN
jgi:hypothetical protein